MKLRLVGYCISVLAIRIEVGVAGIIVVLQVPEVWKSFSSSPSTGPVRSSMTTEQEKGKSKRGNGTWRMRRKRDGRSAGQMLG